MPLVDRARRLAGEALVMPAIAGQGPILDEVLAALDAAADTDAGSAGEDDVVVVDPRSVGRPPGVTLVAPRELRRRTWGTPTGRFATVHALAHIEANAVNLALDAVHRFAGMPVDYYRDWARVAAEELGHFLALGERLAAYGGAYGDLGCHDGLWDIAVRTAGDVGARMALVPLVFEARGLDVTPGLVERFEHHDDAETAAVLRIVLRDEIGHVEVGSRWFAHVCAERDLDPRVEFERLVGEANLLIVPPFNVEARVAAGFDADDLRRWEDAFVGSRDRPTTLREML
ncbi:MAG: ferritin-like domain-containing protein [Acidimicrobiales bacterium]